MIATTTEMEMFDVRMPDLKVVSLDDAILREVAAYAEWVPVKELARDIWRYYPSVPLGRSVKAIKVRVAMLAAKGMVEYLPSNNASVRRLRSAPGRDSAGTTYPSPFHGPVSDNLRHEYPAHASPAARESASPVLVDFSSPADIVRHDSPQEGL